jgi:uncharacterized protein (DUF58 family)
MKQQEVFYYRKPAQQSVFPGAHPGKIVGSGQLFKHHVPLILSPDLRHIDLRASVLDPFENFQIKVFQQQSQLNLFLLADLSASMNYQGEQNKQQSLVECLQSIAKSAYAHGDRFGFVGCGRSIDSGLVISPANQQQGRVTELAKRLKKTNYQGCAESFLQAANYLPSKAALVFLLSDFYMPTDIIQQQMQRLNQHTVVPLVLWDQQEYNKLPQWGVVKFADMELRKTRTQFMRPALKQRIVNAFKQRKQLLQHCFRSFGCEPLFFENGYRAELMTHYFLQHST